MNLVIIKVLRWFKIESDRDKWVFLSITRCNSELIDVKEMESGLCHHESVGQSSIDGCS